MNLTLVHAPESGSAPTYAEAVATEVRAMLARTQITQTQLANALNMSQMAVSRRLRGLVAFDVVELYAVAQLLGCRITDLLPGGNNGGDPVEEVRGRTLPRLDSNQQPFGYRPDYPTRDHGYHVRAA